MLCMSGSNRWVKSLCIEIESYQLMIISMITVRLTATVGWACGIDCCHLFCCNCSDNSLKNYNNKILNILDIMYISLVNHNKCFSIKVQQTHNNDKSFSFLRHRNGLMLRYTILNMLLFSSKFCCTGRHGMKILFDNRTKFDNT